MNSHSFNECEEWSKCPLHRTVTEVTSFDIDSAAMQIIYEQPTEQIRQTLMQRGLSEYSAWLAYKAAKQLIKAGVYEPKRG